MLEKFKGNVLTIEEKVYWKKQIIDFIDILKSEKNPLI